MTPPPAVPASRRTPRDRGVRRPTVLTTTPPHLLILALVCILSRAASAIYYIEDPDSLRFALGVQDYDLAELQPHFPGYPVFCFAVKLVYISTGSYAIAFSIIGGLSVFLTIHFLLRIVGTDLTRPLGGWVAAVVFFNPLIWLMSNRYMADLAGLACALAALYYLLGTAEGGRRNRLGFLLAGLLPGVRVSYLPLLLVPVVAQLVRGRERGAMVAWGALGILVWFVPFVLVTGWETLVAAAGQQAAGHFTEFGGTVFTESSPAARAAHLAEGIFADGLGTYWPLRHPVTLVVTAGVALGLLLGRTPLIRSMDRRTRWLLAGSGMTYLIWIFLFQNVIHKSRHVLPLLPLLIPMVAAGWFLLSRRRRWIGRATASLFLGSYALLTLVLVVQHREPTAIAQVKDYVAARQSPDLHVVSIPLVNSYLSAQGIDAQFVAADDPNALERLERLDGRARIILVGSSPSVLQREPVRHDVFYHNPYVNRMWSEVEVYEYGTDVSS